MATDAAGENVPSLTPSQRRVLGGRTPEQFECMYGPKAADRLFGPRHTCTPIRPLRITVSLPSWAVNQ